MVHICMLVTSQLQNDPRVQREAQFTHDSNYQVTVICREYNGTTLPYRVLPLNIGRQKQQWRKYIERLRFNAQLIFKVIQLHPDIVHANDFDTLPAGYIGSRLTRAKLVYDSHESWNDLKYPRNSWIGHLSLAVERFFARRANAVSTVGNALSEKLAITLGIKKPYTILNTPYYRTTGNIPAGDWILPFKGRKVILYQGLFTAHRCLDQVVHAAHYLDDDIIIALRGYGPYEDNLRNLVAHEELQNRVFFLEPVAMNDMINAVVGADFGLISHDPKFQGDVASPNKLFEYIMAGVPPIATDLTAVHDVMDGLEICAFFRSGDAEHLASVINALCHDDVRREQMKTRCRQYAFQFSWDNDGRKLIDMYEAVLQQ